MLYYANGGPVPATKLLRVDASGDGDYAAWRSAPAERWQVKGGWKPEPNAQLDIQCLGELFLIDESEVLDVQYEMLVPAGGPATHAWCGFAWVCHLVVAESHWLRSPLAS